MFVDRADAGRTLAGQVLRFRDEQPVVVALPRGGVPVAREVAAALGAPLDVIIVRKLGVPDQPELAMGAIGEAGVRVLNPDVIRAARVSPEAIDAVDRRERAVVAERSRVIRSRHPRIPLRDRIVIIVDDGLATGATARAAIQVARAEGAAFVVLAVPVAPADTVDDLAVDADAVIAVAAPVGFGSVGQWYGDFSPVEDATVLAILDESRAT